MFENFLTHHKIALLVVSKADVALLDGISIAITKCVDQILCELERMLANVKSDPTNMRHDSSKVLEYMPQPTPTSKINFGFARRRNNPSRNPHSIL